MSAQQLSRQLAYQKKQTSYAWAKYYEAEREQQTSNIQQYTQVVRVVEQDLPEFVKAEMTSMMEKLKKKIECPICLEVMEPSTIGFANCGHKYCKECLDKLKTTTKKCAVCRRKIAK